MARLRELRDHAIRALRLGEWATSELAINAMLAEAHKIPEFSRPWCEGVVKMFYAADFARLADVIEYEFPIRFIESTCPPSG